MYITMTDTVNSFLEDAQDKWIEARRRLNAILALIYWSHKECECNGIGDACKPCRARARLKDEGYDPLCSTF